MQPFLETHWNYMLSQNEGELKNKEDKKDGKG
jgi:hypothetical protein